MKNQKKQNNNFTCRFAYTQDLNTFCDTVGTCPLEVIKMMIMKKCTISEVENSWYILNIFQEIRYILISKIDFCYYLKSKIWIKWDIDIKALFFECVFRICMYSSYWLYLHNVRTWSTNPCRGSSLKHLSESIAFKIQGV